MTLDSVYRTSVRWFMRLVYLAFALVLMGSAYGVYLGYQLVTPVGAQESKTFVLKPGTPANEVAEQLHDQGFIRSVFAFRVMLKVTHTADKLQPGEHALSPSMNAMQVRDELMKVVELPAVSVTIPEGLWRAEVAAIVARKLKDVSAKAFLAFTIYPHDTFPDKKYLPSTDLEGYLFPDTYQFEAKSTPKMAVERMLKRFEEVVLALPEVKAQKFPQHLTLHQIIILASLVEAEARTDDDRPLIAGVYLNRLQKQMRLECDATILFGEGQRKVPTVQDLRFESPYNTYLHDGLPPGPICNPGLKSIQAALHPRGDFLFYVKNDKKSDGSHVFARTFSEHQANIRNYSK